MKVKSTVRFPEINEFTIAFLKTVLKAEKHFGLPITITSGNDSKHCINSFHYSNQAWDIRINDISIEQAEARRAFISADLGYKWDVIIERYENHFNDHIHVERDTRKHPER